MRVNGLEMFIFGCTIPLIYGLMESVIIIIMSIIDTREKILSDFYVFLSSAEERGSFSLRYSWVNDPTGSFMMGSMHAG